MEEIVENNKVPTSMSLKIKVTRYHIFIFAITLFYLILMIGSRGSLGGDSGVIGGIGSVIEIGVRIFFSLPFLILDMIPIVVATVTIVLLIFDKPVKPMWIAFMPAIINSHLLYYIFQVVGFHISWQFNLGTFLLFVQLVYFLVINEKNKRATENFKTFHINFDIHKYNGIIMIVLIAMLVISIFIPLISPAEKVSATLEAGSELGRITSLFSGVSKGAEEASGALTISLRILTLIIKVPFIVIAIKMIKGIRENGKELVVLKKKLLIAGVIIFLGTPFLIARLGLKSVITVPFLNHFVYVALILWVIAEIIYVREVGQLVKSLGSKGAGKYESYLTAVKSSIFSLDKIITTINKIPFIGKKMGRYLSKESKLDDEFIMTELNDDSIVKNQTTNDTSKEKISRRNKSISVKINPTDEFKKFYALFQSSIYTNEEFDQRKKDWIEGLKTNRELYKDPESFLLSLSEYVNDEVITTKELEVIKYIVIGTYHQEVKEKQQQERQIKIDEYTAKSKESLSKSSEVVKSTSKTMLNTVSKKLKELSTITSRRLIKINEGIREFYKKIVDFAIKQKPRFKKLLSKRNLLIIAIVLVSIGIGITGIKIYESNIEKSIHGLWKYENSNNASTNNNDIYLMDFKEDGTYIFKSVNNNESTGQYHVKLNQIFTEDSLAETSHKVSFDNDTLKWDSLSFISLDQTYYNFLSSQPVELDIREGSFDGIFFTGNATMYTRGKTEKIYDGDLVNNFRDGIGTEYFANGSILYKGAFKDGKYNGDGTLYKTDGSVEYEGIFSNGSVFRGLYDLPAIAKYLNEVVFAQNNLSEVSSKDNALYINRTGFEKEEMKLIYQDFTGDGVDDLMIFANDSSLFGSAEPVIFLTTEHNEYKLVTGFSTSHESINFVKVNQGIIEVEGYSSGAGGGTIELCLLGYNNGELNTLESFSYEYNENMLNSNANSLISYHDEINYVYNKLDDFKHFIAWETRKVIDFSTSNYGSYIVSVKEYQYDPTTNQYSVSDYNGELLPNINNSIVTKETPFDYIDAGDIIEGLLVERIKYEFPQDSKESITELYSEKVLKSDKNVFGAYSDVSLDLRGNKTTELDVFKHNEINYDFEYYREPNYYYAKWETPQLKELWTTLGKNIDTMGYPYPTTPVIESDFNIYAIHYETVDAMLKSCDEKELKQLNNGESLQMQVSLDSVHFGYTIYNNENPFVHYIHWE